MDATLRNLERQIIDGDIKAKIKFLIAQVRAGIKVPKIHIRNFDCHYSASFCGASSWSDNLLLISFQQLADIGHSDILCKNCLKTNQKKAISGKVEEITNKDVKWYWKMRLQKSDEGRLRLPNVPALSPR